MGLLTAINPLARSATADQAIAANRSASIALFLGAAMSIAVAVMMLTVGADDLRVVSQAVADEFDLAGRGKMIADLSLAAMLGSAVGQLLLGIYHWRHPGNVIPIIALIIVAWGIVQGIRGFSGSLANPGDQLSTVKLVLMVIQFILFAAAIRGGLALERFRRGQANPSGTSGS